jgi:hypothetical protein
MMMMRMLKLVIFLDFGGGGGGGTNDLLGEGGIVRFTQGGICETQRLNLPMSPEVSPSCIISG